MTKSLAKLNYDAAQLNLIRRTYAKDCNESEFDLFMQTCAHRGLDPFKREIYAQVFNKKDEVKRNLVMVVGIDGLRKIAEDSGNYRPDDSEPNYTYNESLKSDLNPLGIERANVKVYKQDSNGEWQVIVGTAYWDEFAPTSEVWDWDDASMRKKPTGEYVLKDVWQKMPRLMIAKCAEAQALRKGWSSGSGLYSKEELEKTEMQDVTPSNIADSYDIEKRLKAINSKESVVIQWSAGESLTPEPIGKVGDKIIEKINDFESSAQLRAFKDINRFSLQEYWAKDPNGALEVKKSMESKLAFLEKKNLTIKE